MTRHTDRARARRARRGDLRLVRLEGTRESKYMFSLSFSQSQISRRLLRLGLTFETGGNPNLKTQSQSQKCYETFETGFLVRCQWLSVQNPIQSHVSILSTRARGQISNPHDGRSVATRTHPKGSTRTPLPATSTRSWPPNAASSRNSSRPNSSASCRPCSR
jgi:hypothetical protein